MIGDAPKSPHTGLPGWETEAEEELLTRYAAQVESPGVIVELGGEWGRSAGAFARGAKRGVTIFTIDLFPGHLLFDHLQNLSEAGFAAATSPYQGNTHGDAIEWWEEDGEPNDIHLLFIDADHTFEAVKADIEAWTPHVAVGGVVIFHDVAQPTNQMPHYLHFEVTRAISDWANAQSDFEAIEQVDTMAVFRRVKKAGGDPIYARNLETGRLDHVADIGGGFTRVENAKPLPGDPGDYVSDGEAYQEAGEDDDTPSYQEWADDYTFPPADGDDPPDATPAEKPKKSRRARSK